MNSVLNVKALVGAFNQEKARVGAFSVIVKTDWETDGALHSTNVECYMQSSAVQSSAVQSSAVQSVAACAG